MQLFLSYELISRDEWINMIIDVNFQFRNHENYLLYQIYISV